MPGFRYCSWCNGKGCIACDAEEKKFAEKALADGPKWRPSDVRDVRDAALLAETKRLEAQIGITIGSQEQFDEAEAAAHAAVEAAFKPALDAEYARQFPNGPQPMFTARLDNPADVNLLKTFAHRSVIERVFAGGVTADGLAEMDRLATEARTIQAARQVLCPNEDDLEHHEQ